MAAARPARQASSEPESAWVHAIELLREDHRRIRELLDAFEFTGQDDHGQLQALADEACMEFEIHARAEEEVFYPAIRSESDREGRQMILEATEQHDLIRTMIRELRSADPTDSRYDAKFQILSKALDRHFELEEDDIFPEAEIILGDDIYSMGAQLQARREQLEPD